MKSFWKKCKRYLTDRSNRVPVIFAAIGAVVVTAAVILVVRAYLTAQSDPVQNPFAPMTYTDFEIEEELGGVASTDWNNENLSVVKNAYITVKKTSQLKPVYVRVTVTTAVYESSAFDAVNISAQYPNVKAVWAVDSSDWTAITSNGTAFYYYNKIVLPEYNGNDLSGDGVTANIFGEDPFDSTNEKRVTILHAKDIPAGAQIRVNVIADCVQAVSGDSSKWKEVEGARFTTTEVQQAWGIAPTGTLPLVTATGDNLRITWPTS